MKRIMIASALAALCMPLLVIAAEHPPEPVPPNSAAAEAQGREVFTRMLDKAEQGDRTAQEQVSLMYMMAATEGSDEDLKESGLADSVSDAVKKGVSWMRKLAEQGDVAFQAKLGGFYMGDWKFGSHGEFKTTHDLEQAAKWYGMAAEGGDTGAQVNLGNLYLEGQGVQKDALQAYKWLYIASQQHPQRYQDDLLRAANVMTGDQVSEAQKLAKDWLDNHDKGSP